jgi:hypothetical protein
MKERRFSYGFVHTFDFMTSSTHENDVCCSQIPKPMGIM